MTSQDEEREGRYKRLTHRRIDKLMRDVEHLQQQTEGLLDRCRYLYGQLRIVSAGAGALILIALGVPWGPAIGVPVALAIVDAIIVARRERKADKIVDKWRVARGDFDDYDEAEKRLQEELAEIDKKSLCTQPPE